MNGSGLNSYPQQVGQSGLLNSGHQATAGVYPADLRLCSQRLYLVGFGRRKRLWKLERLQGTSGIPVQQQGAYPDAEVSAGILFELATFLFLEGIRTIRGQAKRRLRAR